MTREELKHITDLCFTAPTAIRRFGEEKTYHTEEIAEAKRSVMELLEKKPKTGHWVPVSERLPEKSGLYLVSIGDLVTALSFCGNGFRTPFGSEYSVDAWQPLPKPYKESEEQK